MLAVVPGSTLWSDPWRSGIGRFSRRPDVAALVVVLVFGAFANAAGMVEPVVAQLDRLQQMLGSPPRVVVTTAVYFGAILVLPLVVVLGAGSASRLLGGLNESGSAVATRFAFSLVPLGFGMWLAHYSFHFLTSWDTIIPSTQRFAADWAWGSFGEPLWQHACCRPAAEWVWKLEILMLDAGLLLSLYTGFRIAESITTTTARAIAVELPWVGLIVLLFGFGVWLVFQPMEMRGTLPVGS
jgi:hypothetical protein